MVATLTSVSTIAAVVAATPELSLQPGTVVDAKVVQIFKNDLVRIALQGVLIDALSEVPLQAGQSLRLAVSQSPQGVRLSVVPSSDGSQASSTNSSAVATTRSSTATNSPPVIAELEAQAVSVATQTAATRQTGLSQLFANLTVATKNDALPQTVQQAGAQVIVLQPSLDESISGARLQQAVAASGIFREALLAQGQAAPAAPDLKSALILLRQTLSVALGDPLDNPPLTTPQTQTSATSTPVTLPGRVAVPVTIVSGASVQSVIDAAQPVAQPRSQADALSLLAAAQMSGRSSVTMSNVVGTDALTELVHSLLMQSDTVTPDMPRTILQTASAQRAGEFQGEVARTNVPPPPFRGAVPSAQAVMPSTLAPDAPVATAVKQLLDDTDGAIARQTLLQIASLPDRADMPGAKTDAAQPRWAFEIPFATPQGTAVAQFEIAKDGGGNAETGSAKRVWRARFSLDVEPAGPVHAIVSLAGVTTSVRMWAERPLTAARLRAGATELAQALQSASLQPSDIVIGEGLPPQDAAAPAGHFIDRAS